MANDRPDLSQFLDFGRKAVELEPREVWNPGEWKPDDDLLTILSRYSDSDQPWHHEPARDQISELRNHCVYEWLNAQRNFKNALKKFLRKSRLITDNKDWENHYVLKFSGIVALCLGGYWDDTANPEKIRVVHTASRKRAGRLATELLQLIDSGIVLISDDETDQLRRLLTSLNEQLAHGAPSLTPGRRDPHLPKRLLNQRLGLLFSLAFRESFPGIITDICDIVLEHSVDQTAVIRDLNPVRQYLKAWDRT